MKERITIFDNNTKLFFLSNIINDTNSKKESHILQEQLPNRNNENNQHIFNSNININNCK